MVFIRKIHYMHILFKDDIGFVRKLRRKLLTDQRYLLKSWYDEHLTWNPSDYGDIKRVPFNSDEVWTPEIALVDSASSSFTDTFQKANVLVNASGKASWFPSTTFNTHCNVDLKNFPFDTEQCFLTLSTWYYRGEEVNLTANSRCVAGPFFKNSHWNLQKTNCSLHSYTYEGATYKFLYIDFEIARVVTGYKYFLLLPYIAASLFAIALFLKPFGSNQRFIYGGFALFILMILLIFIGSFVGFQSFSVPYAVKCLSINIFMIMLSLFITTLVSQYVIKSQKYFPILPNFIVLVVSNEYVTKFLGVKDEEIKRNLEMNNPHAEKVEEDEARVETNVEVRNNSSATHYLTLAIILDRLFFVVYILTMITYHT
ncbi:nicotinic acetylcholine receptor subunit beta3-like protein [Dinothrombium tinctorium]|uniref:Nicotinic acetylcholine receptor subunit beta3-like protein n=1 Tax=Dinothrombium tinctorium TaxID=1965070 RepID=A0A443R1E6_9ACAR|nr:nicotinic acetylcholine receptor subunit beta3-like protein [Dinothrombium tinctorium]